MGRWGTACPILGLVAVRRPTGRRAGPAFGCASNFAPDALQQAVQLYREQFQPSAPLARPHVIAGVNVLAADTQEAADACSNGPDGPGLATLFSRQGQPLNDDDT